MLANRDEVSISAPPNGPHAQAFTGLTHAPYLLPTESLVARGTGGANLPHESDPTASVLSPQQEAEQLEVYWSAYNTAFPLVVRSLFDADRLANRRQYYSRPLETCMIAIAARHSAAAPSQQRCLYVAARHTLLSHSQHDDCLSTVQCLLLMAELHCAAGNIERARTPRRKCCFSYFFPPQFTASHSEFNSVMCGCHCFHHPNLTHRTCSSHKSNVLASLDKISCNPSSYRG